MKRLQNKIAESGLLLPGAVLLTCGLQLLGRLPATPVQWLPLPCLLLSAYLMVELSNGNALLRVRSRMVTTAFLVLNGTAGFFAGSIQAAVTQLMFIAALLVLFTTYQDRRSMGRVYYAFLFFGLASVAWVQTLWLVPLLWLLMATQLLALSWRTWLASLLGLLTPYWLMAPWLIFNRDVHPIVSHFTALASLPFPCDYSLIPIGQYAVYVFTLLLVVTGIIHFWHRSYEDKIRIRLLYGLFTTMSLVMLAALALQPQHYDVLMRLCFIFASPLIAHFLTLTSTRITNIAFWAIAAAALLITLFNLWMPSLTF